MDTVTVAQTRKTSILLRIRRSSPEPVIRPTDDSIHPRETKIVIDDSQDDESSSSHYKFFMDDVEDADGPKSSDEDHSLATSAHNPTVPLSYYYDNNAITSNTVDNSSTYIFRNIHDRERLVHLVQLLICRLHQNYKNKVQTPDAIKDNKHTVQSSQVPYYETLKDTDQTSIIHPSTVATSSSWTVPTNTSISAVRKSHRRRISRSRSVTPYRHPQLSAIMQSNTDVIPPIINDTAVSASSRQRFWSEWSHEQAEESSNNIMEADTSMFIFRNTTTQSMMAVSPTADLDMDHCIRTWTEKKGLFMGLDNEAIALHTIPCSIHDFFSWFMSDLALYPMHPFLTQVIGDTNVYSSSWTDISPPFTHFFEKTRQLTLDHRLSTRLGPSHAATTRTQTCTFIHDTGLCIQEKTQISNAPAADCFYIETIWILEPCSTASLQETSSTSSNRVDTAAQTLENKCCIQVRFQIHFIKGAILKSIISAMTRSETKHWFQEYLIMVQSACQEQKEQQDNKERRADCSQVQGENLNHDNQNNVVSVIVSPKHRVDPKTPELNSNMVRQDSLHGWMWILLSSLSLFLLFYWNHHITIKVNILEKEIQRLQQACIIVR